MGNPDLSAIYFYPIWGFSDRIWQVFSKVAHLRHEDVLKKTRRSPGWELDEVRPSFFPRILFLELIQGRVDKFSGKKIVSRRNSKVSEVFFCLSNLIMN